MALINGDDFVSGSVDSFQQNNRMKDHWRLNIADLTNPSEGMIKSIPVTNLLEHCQVDSTPGPIVWEEIVQTNTPISDDKQLIGGTNSDSILIPYEETLNDAIIWGLPVTGKRKLIFCDVGDVGANFTGLIGTGADVAFYIVDADTDTIMGVGFNGDDTPGIWGDKTIHIQHHAGNDAAFFAGAEAGENPYIYIYGWETGRGARNYTRLQMSDTNNEFIIESENNADHEGITISLTEAGQRFRVRQGAGILSWYLDGTDAFMRWSCGSLILQTDEGTDTDTIIDVKNKGAATSAQIYLWDHNSRELGLFTGGGRAYIESIGGALGLNPSAAQDIHMFENASSSETPELKIYGFRAADARRSLEIGVGVDAADTASFDGVSNYYFDGNVGVKTLPGADLHVYQAATTDAFPLEILRLETADEGVDLVAGMGGKITFYMPHDTASFEGAYIAAQKASAGDAKEDTILVFATSPDAGVVTERMRIDPLGNLGLAQTIFGTNAEGVYAQGTETPPTTSPPDAFQMWSADVLGVANKAGPHWRSEEDGMYAWHGGAGTINNFTYQGDVADDATFNLPAITDSAWGFIQFGDNEEYALFTVDNDGDVTLISNSANIVANADTDGSGCIGTAATQEPLVIRNRLGAQKNINLIIWYS